MLIYIQTSHSEQVSQDTDLINLYQNFLAVFNSEDDPTPAAQLLDQKIVELYGVGSRFVGAEQ